MNQVELNKIIASHDRWLRGEDGERANLENANLQMTDLCGANLQEADLCGANLRYADLRGANLQEADLRDAYLRYADLRGANLKWADLRGASLPAGIFQVVGCGSQRRCTTYDAINDRIICGCWDDNKGNHLDSFTERIESIYGPNGIEPDKRYYEEYMDAIRFFETAKMRTMHK